jgi:hypothetical protein
MIHRLLKRIIPRRLQLSYQARQFISRSAGGRVCSGPFAGMAFASSDVHPKYLLGTYELELHPVLRQLSQQPFDLIVDVGAETGYYAVGFARLIPHARVLAFEADEKFHVGIHEMARANGVEGRLAVAGFCGPDDLKGAIQGSNRCLVFMDCEGGERLLLDPAAIPELKRCQILAELHDFIDRGIAGMIGNRFQSTHAVTEVWSKPRTIADFPLPAPRSLRTSIFRKYYVSAMNEGRPERMRWHYLAN